MTVAPRKAAGSWLEFWAADTAIYANTRHKEQHYAALAQDLAEHVPSAAARILDYGCGEALSAAWLARSCGALLLYDASPHVRRRLFDRFCGVEGVSVLRDDALGEVKNASLDLIVAVSLIQYLSRSEFLALLDLWRMKLKADGRLLIADVPPPQAGVFADTLALLHFGWRGGFFGAALISLARLYFSDYRRLRRESGFSRYAAAELEALLLERGYRAQRLRRNLGHNPRRFSVLATQAGAPRRAD